MKHLKLYVAFVQKLHRNAKLFLAHTLFLGLSVALLSLLYNLYIQSLGFHEDMIGTVTLIACTVAVIASLPASWVLNRLGYKRALISAVLLTAFSILLPLLVPEAWALIACEIFWGMGFTLLVIAGAPFMTENSTDQERAQLFGLQFVLMMLTAFIANLIGGMLPRWFGAWFGVSGESMLAYQGALYISVGLMALSAVPFLFIRPQHGEKHTARLAPRFIVRKPAAVGKLLTPYIIGAIGAGMFVPFANVLWKTTQGVSDATLGNIFALSALLMVGAGMLSPGVAKRIGAVRTMVVYQLFAMAGLLMFGFASPFGIVLVGYLARDVMMNLVRPVYGQFMMEQSEPAERAAVSAWATMGFNLAWGVSSWVSGVLQSANLIPWVIVASAGFGVLAAVLMPVLFRTGRTAHATPAVTRPMGAPAE